jgi:hypothetical protein
MIHHFIPFHLLLQLILEMSLQSYSCLLLNLLYEWIYWFRWIPHNLVFQFFL